MEGKRLIKKLCLRNFLSHGPDTEEISLGSLNVLIGRNGSGKSNLIEAVSLLKAAPANLAEAIRQGGGVGEWLWKGPGTTPEAEIEAVIDYPQGQTSLRYEIWFTMVGQRFEVTSEAGWRTRNGMDDDTVAGQRPEMADWLMESERDLSGDGCFFLRVHGTAAGLACPPSVITEAGSLDENGSTGTNARRRRLLRPDTPIRPDRSLLSLLRDPNQYPEITYLGDTFGQIRLYREWNLGRDSEPRRPQSADLPEDFLEESARNLGMVLNDIDNKPSVKRKIIEKLREFYTEAEGISTKVVGGTVQIFIHEKGLSQPVPATRLSDGTIRYLCLLTLLCHPSPPPLICIEEPELGLHPDILPTIAELLIDASQRTQIIVTTHSDTLVSALSDVPESVLVCEHDQFGTHVKRLEPDRLEEWLKKYSLGELWGMGEIGG
jgi:predicted ATPase